MPAPVSSLMKTNIKIALLSKIDIATGHPVYCKKTVDGNGNIVYDDLNLMPSMEDMIGYIADGICTTWTTWQASQTVVGVAVVSTAPGSAPVTGNLP